MCTGGGSAPKPAPPPAQAAPVSDVSPELDLVDDEKASTTGRKKRRGVKGLRIDRTVNVPGGTSGNGTNVPTGM
jgi:hypothetical protein